jgi:hypothetical protein
MASGWQKAPWQTAKLPGLALVKVKLALVEVV